MTDAALSHPYAIFAALALTLAVSHAGSMLAARSGIFMDDPNHRSSHAHVTSRAGGIAMLAAMASGVFVLSVFAGMQAAALPLLGLGAFAGAVGLADDRHNLPASIKCGGQLIAAILFVCCMGPLGSASLPFLGDTPLGLFGIVITAFWLVAFMNVFNFMDGVNGIAGGAAALGLFFYGIVALSAGAEALGAIALVTAAAAAGFLPTNIIRGKLFMGDCGSHFLAFMIGALAVYGANETDGTVNALLLPTIFLPFIIDVAFTMIHRTKHGENLLAPHRDHIYQLILRMGASHASVAAIYCGAVCFCAAGAILMLTIPSPWMWVIPVGLTVVFVIAGRVVYVRAKRNGLLPAAMAS